MTGRPRSARRFRPRALVGRGPLAPVPACAAAGGPRRGGQPERGDRAGDRLPRLRRRPQPGAVLPGGDLRTLAVTVYVVLVLLIGTVVTYLIVPQPTGSGIGDAPERLECRARVLRGRPDRLPRDGRHGPDHPAAARLTARTVAVGRAAQRRHPFRHAGGPLVWHRRSRRCMRPLALFAARPSHLAAPLSFLGVSRVAIDEQHHRPAAAVRRPCLCPAPVPVVVGDATVRPRRAPDRGLPDRRGARVRATLPPRAYAPGGVASVARVG